MTIGDGIEYAVYAGMWLVFFGFIARSIAGAFDK